MHAIVKTGTNFKTDLETGEECFTPTLEVELDVVYFEVENSCDKKERGIPRTS